MSTGKKGRGRLKVSGRSARGEPDWVKERRGGGKPGKGGGKPKGGKRGRKR